MEESEGNGASHPKTAQNSRKIENLWYKLLQSEVIALYDLYPICGRNLQLCTTFLPQFLPQVKSRILAIFGEFWQNIAPNEAQIPVREEKNRS